MAKHEHITGFEFPIADSDGYVDPTNTQFCKYDYNSLANIPEHENYVSLPTKNEYKIDNNVHVTKNLQTSGNLNIGGALTGKVVITSDSFGDSLPTSEPHVAGRIFFVKLQD